MNCRTPKGDARGNRKENKLDVSSTASPKPRSKAQAAVLTLPALHLGLRGQVGSLRLWELRGLSP